MRIDITLLQCNNNTTFYLEEYLLTDLTGNLNCIGFAPVFVWSPSDRSEKDPKHIDYFVSLGKQ